MQSSAVLSHECAFGAAGVDWSWVLGVMGGTVDRAVDGTANIVVPSHTWNEIELPHSNCYIILGGQTSTLRDTTDSAFRLVLHDTTFRSSHQYASRRCCICYWLHLLLAAFATGCICYWLHLLQSAIAWRCPRRCFCVCICASVLCCGSANLVQSGGGHENLAN